MADATKVEAPVRIGGDSFRDKVPCIEGRDNFRKSGRFVQALYVARILAPLRQIFLIQTV